MDSFIKILAFSAFIGIAFAADASGEWFYEGDKGVYSWASNSHYPQCDANNNPRQSPIDLTDAMERYGMQLPHLNDQYNVKQNVELINKGLHVQFTIQNQGVYAKYTIDGNETWYRLLQGHFHWGRQYMAGSEHTVDGHQYKGELHLVHLKSTVDVSKATSTPDSLMVIGVFLEEDYGQDEKHDNPAYSDLFSYFSQIQSPGAKVEVDNVKPRNYLPHDYNGTNTQFYHYKGGLTTPGCAGVVNWIVLKEPIKLSSSLLERSFYNNGPLREYPVGKSPKEYAPQGANWRPVQPRGNRMVYINQHHHAVTTVPGTAASTAVPSFITVLSIALIKMFF